MIPAMAQSTEDKLKVLVEGAKYDVSCSSSNSPRGARAGFLGSCAMEGICHSYTRDGRCISLLKLLMTNKCEFDCAYCVNRRSGDAIRASLTPEEICKLVEGFYRRNYIEGLFLSSAVERSPDFTMQRIIETLILLRTKYKFRGYVHVKAIPGSSAHLIDLAARYADRMSVNIELPSENSLSLLAPQKKKEMIVSPMRRLANIYEKEQAEKGKYRAEILPAGQTTQMIIGASPDTDGQIIRLSQALYRNFGLKRVYYSAYTPVVQSSLLPSTAPPLKRENRLYQADWLMRFYGFEAEELLPPTLDFATDVDPKCDWALRNIDKFPLEVNTASYEMLLRVPGIGVTNAYRIIKARKKATITFDVLKRMRVNLSRAVYFITADGKYNGIGDKPELIRLKLSGGDKALLGEGGSGTQISMFDTDISTVFGEM